MSKSELASIPDISIPLIPFFLWLWDNQNRECFHCYTFMKVQYVNVISCVHLVCFLALVITNCTAFSGNYLKRSTAVESIFGQGLVPGKIKTPNMTVNETRRKKMEAISLSQPTLTESEGNWRCQGVCLQNLERAAGVVERTAPRPIFLARKSHLQ